MFSSSNGTRLVDKSPCDNIPYFQKKKKNTLLILVYISCSVFKTLI